MAFFFRVLKRDINSKALKILAVCLIIAVANFTSIGFFVDRLSSVLVQQASEILGADLLVSSSERIGYKNIADKEGLQSVSVLEFPTMAVVKDRSVMISVKAVELGYPLRGTLKVKENLFQPEKLTDKIPEEGEIWVQPSLLIQLGAQVGDTLQIGYESFKIKLLLTYDASLVGGGLFSLAPRVMMNLADIHKTRLINAASRVKYKLLVAGESENIRLFREGVTPNLLGNEKLVDIENAQPALKTALERARVFLNLAAIVCTILSGVGIVVSARYYVFRRLDYCAVLRCLGASYRLIQAQFVWQLLVVGLVSGLVGCFLGYLAQFFLVEIFGETVNLTLPAPSLVPAFNGLLFSFILLFGFTFPVIQNIKNIPPMRALKKSTEIKSTKPIAVILFSLVTGFLLLSWQTGQPQLSMLVLSGLLVCVIVLYACGYVFIHALSFLSNKRQSVMRIGLRRIKRNHGQSLTQIICTGIGIMVLMILAFMRGDLMAAWGQQVANDAPNKFMINIQPDQVNELERLLVEENIVKPKIFPMIRGRMSAINGVKLDPDSMDDPRAKALVLREFNMSWSKELPSHNKLVEGVWWDSNSEDNLSVSVEAGLVKTLGLKLNDELSFSIAGEEVVVTIKNIREVDWDSFNVNFYVILPEGILEKFPVSYITSFYLPQSDASVQATILQEFPNITFIDIERIMNHVSLIIDRVSQSVEVVFFFAILAGMSVFYAMMLASSQERQKETVILRVLGAQNLDIRLAYIAEFTMLGLVSGLVAVLISYCVSNFISVWFFDIYLSPNWGLMSVGIIFSIVLLNFIGMLSTRKIINSPPRKILVSE